jgi:hypothetical protein
MTGFSENGHFFLEIMDLQKYICISETVQKNRILLDIHYFRNKTILRVRVRVRV